MSECEHIVQSGGRGCSCDDVRRARELIADAAAAFKAIYDIVDAPSVYDTQPAAAVMDVLDSVKVRLVMESAARLNKEATR